MVSVRGLIWMALLIAPGAMALDSVAQPQETGNQPSLAELIEQLNSQEPVTRERAEQHLKKIGVPAKKTLQAILPTCDLEFRTRAKRILRVIEEREALALCDLLETQIEQFTQDKATIPGWKRYRQIVGEDQASREFFFTLFRAEPGLLLAYEEDPRAAARAFRKRCLPAIWVRAQELFPGIGYPMFQSPPEPQNHLKMSGSLAALLLVAGDEKVKLSENSLVRLGQHPAWNLSFAAEAPAPLKKLAIAAILAPTDHDMSKAVASKIVLASRFPCEETATWLVQVASDPRQATECRLQAAVAAIRIAGKPCDGAAQLQDIEKLLTDSTPITDKKVPLGDILLTMLVVNAGQPIKDYHLPEEAPSIFWGTGYEKLQLTAAQRKQAIAKWLAWSKTQQAWNRELVAFAAGGNPSPPLPCWQRFKLVAGDTPKSRAVFIQLQRAEQDLLTSCGSDEKAVENLLNERLKRPVQSPFSVAACLLLAGDQAFTLTGRSSQQLDALITQYDAFRTVNEPKTTPVLQQILAHYRDRDRAFNDLLAAFSQDHRGIWKLSVPGWERYRKSVGAKNAERMFFIEMQRTERSLLVAYHRRDPALLKEFETCCQNIEELYPEGHWVQPTIWPSFATLLLVMSDKEIELPEEVLLRASRIAYRFVESLNYSGSNPGASTIHELVSRWISRPTSEKMVETAYQKVRLAMKYKLCKDPTAFLQIAKNSSAEPRHRIQALLGLASVLEMQKLHLVTPLLKEKAFYKHQKGTIALRDVVLAVLVHATRQNIKEYGIQIQVDQTFHDSLNPLLLFETLDKPEHKLKIEVGDGQKQALAKWDAWHKTNRELWDRLKAFGQGKIDDLPGWQRFRKLAGDTPQSRKLFVEMQYVDPELLAKVDANPKQAAALLELRCKQFTQRTDPGAQGPSRAAAAAVLFVAGEEQIELTPDVNLKLAQTVNAFTIFYQDKSEELLRKLLLRCAYKPCKAVAGQPTFEADTSFIYLMIGFALNQEKEILHFGARFLRLKLEGIKPTTPMPNAQYEALTAVTKYGDASHVDLIEPFLDDQSPFFFQQTFQTRDYALAALVRMTGQKYADYGMPGVVEDKQHAWWILDFNTLKFESPEDRDKAIAKWRKWSKANSKSQDKPEKPEKIAPAS